MARKIEKLTSVAVAGGRRTKVVKCLVSEDEKKRIGHWQRIGGYATETDYLRAAALAGAPDLLHRLMTRLGEREMILTELMLFRKANPEFAFRLEELITRIDDQHRDLRNALSVT